MTSNATFMPQVINGQQIGLDFVFAHAKQAMGVAAADGRWLLVNDALSAFLGHSTTALTTMSWQDLVHPDDKTPFTQAFDHALTCNAAKALSARLQHCNGAYLNTQLEFVAITNNSAEAPHILIQLEPAAPSVSSKTDLSLLSFGVNHVHESVLLINKSGHFVYVNDAACKLHGYTRDELLGSKTIGDIKPGFQPDLWRHHWQELQQKRALVIETTHQTKNGDIFPVEVLANYFQFDGKEHNLALVRDISNRKEQQQKIEYLAYHDVLTGLANRSLIFNRLESAITDAKRNNALLAVLCLNLDRFKIVNESLGLHMGDALLKAVAQRLQGVLRNADTVGRTNGDEFLILLPGQNTPQDVAHVTERINSTLSSPYSINNQEIITHASIGVSLYPKDSDNAIDLVKCADRALSIAKKQGRNTFKFYSAKLDKSMHECLKIEHDLRHAIKRKEMFLMYQPQINLVTDKIFGAEALLRWQHPTEGLIPPDVFIPIAEETGLINSIGEWVLRKACLQAQKWNAATDQQFYISINLSRRQLEKPHLSTDIANILLETGCAPELLELEITESAAMTDPEAAIKKLKDLNQLGIQLALDDFGTGYSNLAYLKRFPFNRLKIDRSFVSEIPADDDDSAIVKATITLAHQLRLKVIAEGVETDAQKNFLLNNNCDEMQGYLLAKPLAPTDLERLCGLRSSSSEG